MENDKQLQKFDNTSIELNYKKEELNVLVKKSSNITANDLKDKAQIEVVKNQRIELKKVRCEITNDGKQLRDKANAFSKAVITREKELIAIIEPEESRLSAIEEEARQIKIKERRISELPEKREKLATIGDNIEEPPDDVLVEMDDNTFGVYFNQRVSEKNEADKIENERLAQEKEEEARKEREVEETVIRERQEKVRLEQEAKQKEIDEKERKVKEAEDKIAHEKDLADARETAKKEAEQKAKDETEREERDERRRVELEDADRRAEAEKLAKEERYQKFLSDNGHKDNGDFHLSDKTDTVVLWKKVAVFIK